MAVFSFKSKSKDGAAKPASAPASDEQPKSTYRHVPTHAASDSMGSNSVSQFKSRDANAAPSRQRMSFSSLDGSLNAPPLNAASLNGAAYTRAIAYNMAHRTPSPGSPYNFNRRSLNPITRSISEEVLPIESDSQLQPSSASVRTRRAGPLRSHSDWPLHRSTRSSPLIHSPKPVEETDLPAFLDSGYVSREQSTGEASRPPSDQNSNASVKNGTGDDTAASEDEVFVDATQYSSVAASTSQEPESESRKEGAVACEPVSARDSGVSMSTRHDQAVAPSELRAAISAQAPRSGELPVFDQSEVFMPPFTQSALSKSQPELPVSSPSPRELGADGARLVPQDLRRPVRPTSDRSLTDLSRAYARPTMNPVPENHVAEDEPEVSNKELFSYKGQVPIDDSLQQSVRLRNSSPGASQRPVSLAPAPVSSASVIPKSVQFSSGPAPLTRRATTSNMSIPPQLRPALVTRGSHTSQRRSPLSSHEATPNGSDSGADVAVIDDNTFPAYTSHSRSASVRTSRSTATMSAKPRTYFSHSGKVTIDPSSLTITQPTQSKGIETSSVTVVEAKADKKKRFSLNFSRSQKA